MQALERHWLVLGFGSIGRRHTANLRSLGVSSITVFDPDPARTEQASPNLGPRFVTDPEAAYANDPDIVVVCSPTNRHREDVARAIDRGCDLFVEKPLAEGVEGLAELASSAERRGLRSLVGCNFRFHPGQQRVRELLSNTAVGEPLSFHATFGQYLPDWRPDRDYRNTYSARRAGGGGVLLDRIHEFDYLYSLFGIPRAVSGSMARGGSLDIDVEDRVDAILRYDRDLQGSVHLDYLRREYDCKLRISAERGTIEWSYAPHYVEWLNAETGVRTRIEWPTYDGNEMYLDELRHFLRVLDGEEASIAPLDVGRNVLRMALAVRDSHEQGREVDLERVDT